MLEARGTKDGKVVLTEKRETTGKPESIRLTSDRTEINADGEDVAVLSVEVLDKEGRAIPTAANMISFKVTGEGALIGVGNGDPNCQESDKDPKRSLFNGLAQVIVQASTHSGDDHGGGLYGAVSAAEVAVYAGDDHDEEGGTAASGGIGVCKFLHP